MTEIKIKITDTQAREWRVALAERFKRRTGREPKVNVTLDDLCRFEILRAVAEEYAQQVEESEVSDG